MTYFEVDVEMRDRLQVFTKHHLVPGRERSHFYLDVPGMPPDIKDDFTFKFLQTMPGDDAIK